jgi:hypothetical protein
MREHQHHIFIVNGKKAGELAPLWLTCIALASPNA